MKDLINSFNKMNFDICDYFSIIVMLIATWVFKALGFDRFHTKFYRNIININIHIDNWIIKIIIKIKIKNMGFIIILSEIYFDI
jgi:hypothetical protein